jgi:hypothetical protein
MEHVPGHVSKETPSEMLIALVAKIAALEERLNSQKQEQDDLEQLFAKFSTRIERSIWVTEMLEAVFSTIGGPLKKGLEIAISAGIIYLVTHTRIGP